MCCKVRIRCVEMPFADMPTKFCSITVAQLQFSGGRGMVPPITIWMLGSVYINCPRRRRDIVLIPLFSECDLHKPSICSIQVLVIRSEYRHYCSRIYTRVALELGLPARSQIVANMLFQYSKSLLPRVLKFNLTTS